MACETETKTVGNFKVSITQWPCSKSFNMQLQLIQKIGPVLSIFSEAIEKVNSKNEIPENELINYVFKAIGELFKSNTPDEIQKLITDVITGVRIKPVDSEGEFQVLNGSNYDSVFGPEDLATVYLLFFSVLGVNYKNLINSQRVKEALGKVKNATLI